MEEQLVQAVEIASNPTAVQDPSLPQQALRFLEHLKTITHESWSAGWAVYAARDDQGTSPRYGDQARLFGLSLATEFLENHINESSDPAASVAFLQDAALAFINSEFVAGGGERGASFIKNKLAQFLTQLVLQSYSLPQPATLLPQLVSLFRAHSSPSSSSSPPLNATTTDLVLRMLHDLSVTLGSDVTLRTVRSKERLQRDGVIRDEIRANHAVGVAEAVWSVVEESLQRIEAEGPQSAWPSIAEMAISVVGDYVSWIDISLMVTPRTVNLFFTLLQHSSMGLRKSSADALLEVISKGMKPAGKLELLQVFGLNAVVGSLEGQTRTTGRDDEVVEFRERLAKLANGITLELAKILEDTVAEEATTRAADEMLLAHLPLVLAFLGDEYDEPTECVLSGITATLNHFKRLRKKATVLPQPYLEVLAQLVDVLLRKMKWDDEAEWTAGDGGDDDDDDDGARFIQLRKSLQVLLGAVAAIDESIFATRVQSLIVDTLGALSGGGVSWQRAEVAVYAAYFYVEVIVSAPGQPKTGVNANTFVQLPADAARTRNKLSPQVYPTLPLNALGEMVQTLVTSNVSSFPHPAVQLQFFECLNRYSTFFFARPDHVSSALFAFLDGRGIYNANSGVRLRAWYIFSRFVKETATLFPPDYIERVLEGLKGALAVNATLPSTASDEDPLLAATNAARDSDAQLHLFESCGSLIAQYGKASSAAQQAALLKAVCDPLLGQLQSAVASFNANQSDLREVLQVHDLMLALSNVAKGFPDTPSGSNAPVVAAALPPDVLEVFKTVTEQILVALSSLNRFSIVRDAARGAFARIVSTTGTVVLPFIPNLIQGLLSHLTSPELVDFLSFLGLIVAKYKTSVAAMIDELFLVLVERVFHFLNQEVGGTDDAVARSELQRGYITFLSTLVSSAGMDGVLTSDRNKPQLDSILQSVVYYAENGDPPCQRASFGILGRMVSVWGGGEAGKTNGTVASSAPPDLTSWIYETLVPLAFTVPASPSFDLSDAQSQMVVSEISQLLKTVLSKRGAEELGGWLKGVYLPRIGCPPGLAEEFVKNLVGLEQGKKWKACFATFIEQCRGA